MPRKGRSSEAAKIRWKKQLELYGPIRKRHKTLQSGPAAQPGKVGNPAQSPVKKRKEVVMPEHPQKAIRVKLQKLHNTLFAVASNSSSSSVDSSGPQKTLENETHSKEAQKVSESDKKSDLKNMSVLKPFDLAPIDFDEASLNNGSAEQKSTESSLSCDFSSTDAGLECDPKVNEVLLFLGEADEDQEERYEVKDRAKEKMDVDVTKDEKKEAEVNQSPKAADGSGNSSPTRKKRTFSPEGNKDGTIDIEVKDGKRARVEGMELKNTSALKPFSWHLAPVDSDEASLDGCSTKEKSTESSLSCDFNCPDAGLECDPEMKKADEGQGEWDEVKGKTKEKKDVDGTKDEKKDAEVVQSCKAADDSGNSSPTSKKRTFSSEGEKDKTIDIEVKGGKSTQEESMELELKITANAGSRVKLEKMVQQLVEDRLQVLQFTVFDRTLMEVKERVEKIETATKQQDALQHICTLQAKVSRLVKKFRDANQASEYSKRENIKCLQTTATAIASTQTTSRIQRTTLDPKQPGAAATSSSGIPAQPKPLSSLTTASSSSLAAPAPVLQIPFTTKGSTSSSTTFSQSGQCGTVQLQTRPNTTITTNSMATSRSQSIPVSSLATMGSLNKAKTTTASTIIIQKSSAGNILSTSQSSPSTASQMSFGRSIYQGGTGRGSTSSTAISVPTARASTQCAPVAGVGTASLPQAPKGPMAVRSAAAGVSSASQPDYQAFNSTPAKSLAQSPHPKSSFIDLTEEDDMRVTCVQKSTATSNATSFQRTSESTPLISSTTPVGHFTMQRRPPVDSPSKSRPGTSTPAWLPPLPLAPNPTAVLPPEAAHTSLPQQPKLELAQVHSQNSILLSWCVPETDLNCAAVDSYHLYSFSPDHQRSAAASSQSLWKQIGVLKALPLPMACTLTRFLSNSTFYFAVRAKDVFGRFGPFSEPQCANNLNPMSSGSIGAS